MTSEEPPGATWDRPAEMTSEDYDRGFAAFASDDLVAELTARAYGEDCPTELEAYGMTTWWTLGRLVGHARLRPGGDLVDLACGRGGPGLWLARATSTNLVGVDWSSVGVAEATRRAPSFVPDGRARFVVGDLADTGLPAASADVVLCIDAVFFAPDRIAALSEVARVLRPGGRYLFTAREALHSEVQRHSVPDWAPLLAAAGLTVEAKEQVPRFAEHLGAMYAQWLDNLDLIRERLGPDVAEEMEQEARTVGPSLADDCFLFVARHAS